MSIQTKLQSLTKRSQAAADGKTDLLLRFFESHFFDEWIALQYLYQNTQPGVQDYLCNKLYELGETAVEKYLLQFVYLAIHRPGQALERTIVDLCSKSFRIAIKVQWLLQALCQDHPKSKALESFRDRCYRAALEGQWEVPFRDPHLDPLSPHTSIMASPPFSPGSSMLLQHYTQSVAPHSPTIQPPYNMVMSPPTTIGPSLAEALDGADEAGAPTLAHKRSSSLHIDLGCLLPPEQRGLLLANNSSSQTPTSAPAGPAAVGLSPASQPVSIGPTSDHQLPEPHHPLPTHTLRAPTPLAAGRGPSAPGHGSAFASGPGCSSAATLQPNGVLSGHSPQQPASLVERYQSIRRELGEGEGVTALLERSKQQGAGVVAAVEDEGVLSDDEFSSRPMSPLTRLRHDTFGATLDFIEALCDASSQLTNYPQEERHRALRIGLESINRELEDATRRDVAIWFPMGHRHDRVLRITSKEAVLLNSREKAPFMLFVEVLEQPDQKEADLQPGPQQAASSNGHATAGAPDTEPGHAQPSVQFGRRETYGVALTAVGANHHHHHNHMAPPHHPQLSCSSAVSLPTSTNSGRASLPGTAATVTDSGAASTAGMGETPGGLSPSMSLSSQNRSSAASPVAGQSATAAATAAAAPCTNGPLPVPHGAHGAWSGGHQPAALQHQHLQPPAQAQQTPVLATAVPQLPVPAIFIPTRSTNSFSNGSGGAPLSASMHAAFGASPAPACTPGMLAAGSASAGSPAPTVLPAAAALRGPPVISAASVLAQSAPSALQGFCSAATAAPSTPPHPTSVYPAGSHSPILAAKEVSPQHANSQLSGSALLMAGSSLLRRVLGDKAEPGPLLSTSAPVSRDEPGGAAPPLPGTSVAGVSGRSSKESGFSVVRSLCFSNHEPAAGSPEAPNSRTLGAAADGPFGGSGAISRAAILASALVRGGSGLGGSAHGGHAQQGSGAAASGVVVPPLRPGATEMSEDELQELLQSGCLSPPQQPKADPELTSRMSGLMASLRGEAPLVKLTLRVLPEGGASALGTTGTVDAAAAAAAAAAPANQPGTDSSAVSALHHAMTSSQESVGGSSVTHSDSVGGALAGLGITLGGIIGSKSKPPAPLSSSMMSASGSESTFGTDSGLLDRSKTLLSRLAGLRKRPTMDEEEATTLGQLPPPAGAPASGTAQQVGAAGGAALPPRAPKLVSLRLEVLHGVNLAIPSPYRKSRRTPSHEAIEMLAGKYKVQQMPPPYECGPPLAAPVVSAGRMGLVEESEQEHEQELEVPVTAASFTGQHMLAGDKQQQQQHIQCNGQNCTAGAVSLLTLPCEHPVVSARGAAEPYSPIDCRPDAPGPAASPTSSSGGIALRPTLTSASPPTPTLHHPAPGLPGVHSPAGNSPSSAASVIVAESPPAVLAAAAPPVAPPAATAPAASSSSGFTSTLSSSLSRILARAQGVVASSSEHSTPAGASPSGGSPLRRPTDHAAVPSAAAGPSGAHARAGGGAGAPSGSAPAAGSGAAPTAATRASLLRQTSSRGSFRSGAQQAAQQQEGTEVERRHREGNAIYGERWTQRVKRIQKESPHGRRPGWSLRCVIVKSGDDCRQELLALQLVRAFSDIFQDAALPLWLRYYEVLVTSNRTALIEMVPDTLSIHTLKSRTLERQASPGASVSLSDHFFAKWTRGSPQCVAAQRRFTESLAAYSLVCYLLQIKDRHNGNIMLSDEGHVVHIDFGFMLSNSPGGVNFEAAPFKLTRELLEVMDSNSDGRSSELFDYFKVLMIQGFLACRKHNERLLLLVKMMSKSGFPCFKGGERAIKAMEKRLQLTLTETQCVQHVLQLIADSLDAWRTRQYDYYQRVLNGIL